MHYFSAFFYIFYTLANNQVQNAGADSAIHTWSDDVAARLEINPQFISRMGHNYILKNKNESLNLTCTVKFEWGIMKDPLFDYNLDWDIPFHVFATQKVEKGKAGNIAWLWFESLTENHSGNYTCNDVTLIKRGQPLVPINIHLSVKRNISYCGKQWFRCNPKHCIMKRYVCDGKVDCKEGEDESPEAGCGPDPCDGRVFCDDRCIPPEWCCDHRNCSTSFGFRSWQPDNHEINYVQTALYHTVIGWAMAFMFIVTILLIAICRVHIKRAVDSRWWQHHQSVCRQPEQTLTHGMNIMYNVDSVVQFIGRPVDPPPYSEVIGIPPQERPPPTYESCEHLSEQTVHNTITPECVTYDQTDIPSMTSCNISFSRGTTGVTNIFQVTNQSHGFDVQNVETDTLLSCNPNDCESEVPNDSSTCD